MGEVIASYDPGADITCQHTAGTVGGRGVSVPASRHPGGPAGISDAATGDGLLVVTDPAAGAAIFGVASHDVAAAGKVNIMRAPKVVPMECSAAIAVGAEVMVEGAGKVLTRTAGNTSVGRALSATANAGEFCQVELFSNGALQLS
jgi:predicted RecA/RadA family phage recombinase